MPKQKNKTRLMICLCCLILTLGIIAFCIWKFAPDILTILKHGNQDEIEAYIKSAGKAGIFVLVLLQVLQTITIFFPGIPIYMVAGIMYGKLWGTVICYLTYVFSNTGVFYFSHNLQKTAFEIVNDGDEKQNKLQKLLQKTDHPMVLVGALCVIPLIPNGLVPYIASGTGMTIKQFVKAVAVGCIPGIFLFVCCGDLLMSKYFKLVIGLMIAAIVLMIITFLFKDKIMDWLTKVFGKNEDNSKE